MLHTAKISRRERNAAASSAFKLLVAATAGVVLAGCQVAQLQGLPNFSADGGPGPAMSPAPLPTLNVGDKYYYSNGAREQVVSTEGETVNLISKSKRKLINFRNFAIPQPYVEGATKEYFKESRVPTNALWPLSVGKKVRFSTDGRSVSKDTGNTTEYLQRWSCETTGTKHVRVLAGEFDTYVVECKRFSRTGRWWQNRTWYYAPAISTYVLRRDFYKKSGERFRELTAVRPSLQMEPDNVRQGIIHAWQLALETKKSGELQSWTDKKSGTSVQVEPLNTYKAKNGQFCRTYKQYLTRRGATNIYTGVACRTGRLKWRTPARG